MKMTRKECGYAAVKEKRNLQVEAYLSVGVASAQISRLLAIPEPEVHVIAKQYYLHIGEALWELVSKPLKFPARRRRSDREIPKAA